METVAFTEMKRGTREEYQFPRQLETDHAHALPDRLLAALERVEDPLAGYQVSWLEHSLQAATRAEAGGEDIELIVAALLHDRFQMQHYAHHFGLDPNGHLAWRNHPWYHACMRFCERFDQCAFDPDYPTKPLAYFEPLLRQVFGRAPFDPAVLMQPLRALARG